MFTRPSTCKHVLATPHMQHHSNTYHTTIHHDVDPAASAMWQNTRIDNRHGVTRTGSEWTAWLTGYILRTAQRHRSSQQTLQESILVILINDQSMYTRPDNQPAHTHGYRNIWHTRPSTCKHVLAMPHMQHQQRSNPTSRHILQESVMINQADRDITDSYRTVLSSHAHIQNTCNKQWISLPESKLD